MRLRVKLLWFSIELDYYTDSHWADEPFDEPEYHGDLEVTPDV